MSPASVVDGRRTAAAHFALREQQIYHENRSHTSLPLHRGHRAEKFDSQSIRSCITDDSTGRMTTFPAAEGGDGVSVRNGASTPPQQVPRRRTLDEEDYASIRHGLGKYDSSASRRTSVEEENASARHSALGKNVHAAGTRSFLPLGTSSGSDRWIVIHHRDGFIKPIRRKKTRLWSRPGSRQTSDKGPAIQTRDLEAKIQQGTVKSGSVTNINISVGDKQEDWRRPNDERTFRINIAELQRMRLRKLQWRLVKHVKNLRDLSPFEEEPTDWETDLENYSK